MAPCSYNASHLHELNVTLSRQPTVVKYVHQQEYLFNQFKYATYCRLNHRQLVLTPNRGHELRVLI